ncbi:glycosyltransferase family 4 protein [Serratia proteamaculans]|uniref:glycosyltransferase family 4 protein n=1 Tax=Serratia proteamaculans TaxID=28151 RepID=UPI003D06CBBA
MIYVNARFLTQNLTGVQRFAEEISLELKKIRNDIVFLSPCDILRNDIASKLEVVKIGKRSGHYWEQVELPNYLRKNGSCLLINLGNTGPVFYKNQVVTHHDVTYKKFPQSYSLKFRLVYNVLVPLILRNSRSLITVSEFSKKEIIDEYNYDRKKISVIYNAASGFFNPSNEKNEAQNRFFLAVSSPNFHKNFHGLIRAFSNTDDINGFSLKIIGEKNKNFNGIDLEELSHNNNIEFLGRVSDKELANLYSTAYAFIFPSFYEGFGIPPLEAQACGCPVLSSHAASMPEVLSDSALFFDPHSEKEIADTIRYIAHHPNERVEFIERGYKNIERFSWARSADKLSLLINDLNLNNALKQV